MYIIVTSIGLRFNILFFVQFKPQAVVFEIVTCKKFDMIIMIFIGLNMLTMTLDHYKMSSTWEAVLQKLNLIFICIFASECFLKVFALRWHYFKEPWNLFDFVVVIMSILGKLNFIKRKNMQLTNIQIFCFRIKNFVFPSRFVAQRFHREIFRVTDAAASGSRRQSWSSTTTRQRG